MWCGRWFKIRIYKYIKNRSEKDKMNQLPKWFNWIDIR